MGRVIPSCGPSTRSGDLFMSLSFYFLPRTFVDIPVFFFIFVGLVIVAALYLPEIISQYTLPPFLCMWSRSEGVEVD